MPAIQILREHGSFRLVTDGAGRHAVVEARAGHVYSMHPHHRREAPDSNEGMAEVVGADGWRSAEEADAQFAELTREGDDLSRRMW